tara:strand:+ start:221 stop:466 length:246 start_codon:yes stop_codon:yes gene_type:complete
MSIEPLNTSSIQQFLQQVQSAEASRSREVRMDINSAKALASTLGLVMSRMHGDLEKYVAEQLKQLQNDQVIEISMDSGEWK